MSQAPVGDPAASVEASEKSSNQASSALDQALRASLRGESSSLDAHLVCLRRDIVVGQTKTTLHSYHLPLDGNGRVRFKPLAEFLRDRVIDYAIPRKTIKEAYDEAASGSMAAIAQLHARALRLFTDIKNTGEGGELLLFAMAEAVFGLAQIVCKMSLKTSTAMHYHGADGVYAEARGDGGLNLYWGESKIYDDAAKAIEACLASLRPFLCDPEGEDSARNQDILLANEFANFTDQRLIDALRVLLDKNNPASLTVRRCGIALVGFDSSSYPAGDVEGTHERLVTDLATQIDAWVDRADDRLKHHQLNTFDIHFICVPMPSAAAFREYFLEVLGAK